MLQDEIRALIDEALELINNADKQNTLVDLRQKYLGKKGSITTTLKSIGQAPAEERKELGRLGNEAKNTIQDALTKKEE